LHTVNLLFEAGLPAGFLDPRDLAGMGKFPETYAAHAVFAEISVRTPADFATVVLP